MRKETRDVLKGRKLPVRGLEQMCTADRQAWTDCSELAESGGYCGLLSHVGEDLGRLEESLRCFPGLRRCVWRIGECWVLL